MSEKKSSVSPFKDKAYLQSSSSKNNKYKKQVTQKDKNEFDRVFNDSDSEKKGTDGKGFFNSFVTDRKKDTPIKKAAPSVKTKAVPLPDAAAASDEDLYVQQNVDIDAILESLGAAPTPKSAAKKLLEENQEDDGRTRAFTPSREPKKEKASQRTTHFNLSDAVKNKIKNTIPQPDERADIMGGVRVLSGNKPSDEAILEVAPEGEGKESLLDSLSPEKGEDIFTAVDKAVKRKKNSSSHGLNRINADIAEKINQKKKQEALLTGRALYDSLVKKANTSKIQLVFCLCLFFLSLILTALPLFYSEGNALEFMFSNGGRSYVLINIFILVLLATVFYKSFASAIVSLIEMKPNSDVCLLIITVFVMVHDISAGILNSAGLNGVKMYTLAAIFTATVACLGDYFKSRTALHSLACIMKSDSLQSVQPVENKADANALAKGIADKGEPKILYCADVETGKNLTAGIGPRRDESRFYTYSSIAVLLLSFIMATVLYFRTRDGGTFLSVLLSGICLCMPVTGNTVRSINIYFENLKLNRLGAAATENEGIRSVGKANGVAMDVSDIFTAEVSRFRLVPGVYMNKNDAAVFAAALTIEAGSLMAAPFRDFMKQLEVSMPLTETVQYEEGLGYCGWVDGKRVLVGNRQMLIQHSIPAPDAKEEKRYAKNKFVMYLAVEGQLTASFLVNYKVLSTVMKLSADFNKTGLVLMLTSKEPCLDNKEISKRLSLDTAGVKVLSSKANDIINEYRSNKAMRISSGLVCSHKSRSLLPLVVGAHSIYVSDKFLYNLHITGQAAGFVLLVLSQLLNMPLFLNPLTIILLHILWSIGTYTLSAKRDKG